MPHPCCFASPTHSVYFYIDSPLLYPCCSLWMWNKFNPRHTSVKFFALNGLFERGRCLSLNFICVCMCMSLYWLYRLLEVSAHVFEWSWVVKWGDLLLSWEGMGGGCRGWKKSSRVLSLRCELLCFGGGCWGRRKKGGVWNSFLWIYKWWIFYFFREDSQLPGSAPQPGHEQHLLQYSLPTDQHHIMSILGQVCSLQDFLYIH